MTDDGEQAAGVRDAVEALRSASEIPAKQRAVKVSGTVEEICRYASENGLDADNLRAVVQLASTKTELDQTSVTTLIKNLYPARRIPADVVVTVVGALGQGKEKPSVGTQNGLVKWLITVHDIIDDPKILSRLYGVLFGMLDMISIRTSLCHLLSLITRRKHVKPFRIQQLLQLSRGLGNEPALQGLLRIYKDYYPDIILSSATTSRNSFPPRPDEEWQKRLLTIQDASDAANEVANEQHRGFRVLRTGKKRAKATVPEVHTLYATESSVTLEEIDNADDFVGKLDRIEPPGQLISFLRDPLLQKYVDLKPSPILGRRIELWLATCLENEYNTVRTGLQPTAELSSILEGLYAHAQYSKDPHPVALTFLKAYLPIWNATVAVEAILGLLSYIPLQEFEYAHRNYFAPAERAVASHGPDSYAKLLHFYSALLQHWINQDFHSLDSSPESPSTSPNRPQIEKLVAHVSHICASLLLSIPSDASSPLLSAILYFYETVSAQCKSGVGPIILPPPHLSYLLAQSSSTTTFSRVCGIYANYKAAFDTHPAPIAAFYPPSMTVPFNSCLRDLYNLLWGSKALQLIEKSHAFFCAPALRESLNSYLSRTDNEYTIGLAFGLSHNAWLSSLSAAAWRALEEENIARQGGYDLEHFVRHKGPVTEQTLKALEKNGGVAVGALEYKKFVLGWLAERGCAGVRDLMYATHAKLKQ